MGTVLSRANTVPVGCLRPPCDARFRPGAFSSIVALGVAVDQTVCLRHFGGGGLIWWSSIIDSVS